MNWHHLPFFKKLLNLDTLLFLLIIITLAVSLQQYLLPDREFFGAMRPHYNNYLIFKYSFPHLIQNLNLYDAYPTEYGDLYKYSPSFALAMGLFFWMPDWLGVITWNLLNVLALFFGVKLLPGLKEKSKVFLLLYVLSELIGSMQNLQSNALITGLILLTFVSFERKQLLWAALFVVLALYIKIFGLVAAALFLFYPKKGKFIGYLCLWLVIFGSIPLVVNSPSELLGQYQNWIVLLKSDHGQSYGFSLLGILHQWFNLHPAKWTVTLIGIILFLLAFIRKDLYKEQTFRFLFLASVLIWMVIFNHKAESPTYIIAMAGIGIWFFAQKPNRFTIAILILSFIFTSLLQTDLFPKELRLIFYEYYVKAIPSIVIWFLLLYQMISGKYISSKDLQAITLEE